MKDETEGLDGYDYYEGQPKWPIRRIIKYIAVTISIVMYLVIFVRLIGGTDKSFSEGILLDPGMQSEFQTSEQKVVRIYNETPSDDDGRIQIEFVTFIETQNNFQMTLKMNSKYHPLKASENYRYVLKKTSKSGDATLFEEIFFKSKKKLGYSFLRIAFTSVDFEEDDTLTLQIFDGDKKVYSADVFSPTYYKNEIKKYKIIEF